MLQFPHKVSLVNMEGIELLVHNLSHSDLVLSLNSIDQTLKANSVIARPKFSHFQDISEKIYTCLLSQSNSVSIEETQLSSRKHPGIGNTVPVGFNFSKCPIVIDDLSSLRFRQDDKSKLLSTHGDSATDNKEHGSIESACFPLISVLLPKWINSIDEERKNSFKKVCSLTSFLSSATLQRSITTDIHFPTRWSCLSLGEARQWCRPPRAAPTTTAPSAPPS